MTDKKVIKLEGAVGGAKKDAPPPPLSQVIEQETQALLNTFPEEIWEKVLDNVTSASDLENLAEASPFFKSRVDDRRVVYLFKKVLPILYPTLEAELKKDLDNFWDQSDEQIDNVLEDKGYGLLCSSCGRRRRLHDFSGLLDLRLVCKAWCDGVDNFCENLECRLKMVDIDVAEADSEPYEEVKKNERSMIEDCSGVEFGKVKRVRAFMNHFEGSHGSDKDKNPFLGRSISLSWGFDKPVWEFDMKSTEKVEGKNEESSEDKEDSGNDGDLKATSSGNGNDLEASSGSEKDKEAPSSGSGNGNDLEASSGSEKDKEAPSSGSGNDNDLEAASSDSGSDSDLEGASSSGSEGDSDEWEDIVSDSEGSISSNSDDEDPEGNPLFDPELAKQYNNQVLLKKYGHHVWYCKIDIYDNAIPSPDSCAWLIQMLKLMPNLKVLRIHCSYLRIIFKYDLDEYFEDEWIENCLNGDQFPKLNSLEYLEGRNLSKAFAVQIIKQNPNLKQVELLGYNESPYYGYENLSLIGDSLKGLGLSVCNDEDFEELKNIQVDWPLLETLHLEAANLEEINREDISSWVKSKFGENCKLSINWVSSSSMFARFVFEMAY